jgi:hypothetical protein
LGVSGDEAISLLHLGITSGIYPPHDPDFRSLKNFGNLVYYYDAT